MLTPTECLLKAENYAVVARMARDGECMALLEQAAMWRKRAFELKMLRFEHLREIADDAGAPRRISESRADRDA